MKKIISLLLALVLVCTALSTVCFAQSSFPESCYIKICGIEGMSRNAAHEKWIDVLDYTLNYENGSDTIKGMTFTHLVEPATTKIIDAYMKGMWIPDAEMQVCQSAFGKEHVVLTVQMEHIRIARTEVIVLDDGRVAETVTLVADTVTCVETPVELG